MSKTTVKLLMPRNYFYMEYSKLAVRIKWSINLVVYHVMYVVYDVMLDLC